jgi:AraC-like DNA-binding protein
MRTDDAGPDGATMSAERDPAIVRFSFNDPSPPERPKAVPERFRDLYRRTILWHEFEPARDDALRIEAKFCGLPGLGVAYVSCSAAQVRRTPQHLLNDDLALNVTLSGQRLASVRGRDVAFGEGEAILTSGAEVASSRMSASRFVSFRVPRKPMATLLPDIDDRIGRPIPRDTRALRLLVGYADMLRDTQFVATPEERHVASTHVYDLVALSLGAIRDADRVARMAGVRAARLNEVKAYVERNLASDDLSVADVAAHHRLPVRYLQRLFEEDGASFTAFVLGRRLERARRLLGDPRLVDRPIGVIAAEAGFVNLAYFCRVFRGHFGLTASDVRAQARQRH